MLVDVTEPMSHLTAVLILWVAVPSTTLTATPGCRLSEYSCDNHRCVPLSRYCDNVNDCGDSSDEPRYCTPCNRTYYGDVDKTYAIELHRPAEDRLPFICHLTIKAGGGDFGDIIQLIFDSFTIGRFISFTHDGCPDGMLQISEGGRPPVGGSWCGTSLGPAVYYSETNSVTASIKMFKLSKDQNGYNFDFRLEYKVLRKDSAIVRYGGLPPPDVTPPANTSQSDTVYSLFHKSPTIEISLQPHMAVMDIPSYNDNNDREQDIITGIVSEDYYLGDLLPNTYCARIFSDCDKKLCRLQSPNFPGVYPRNLTCYYAIRQHEKPVGKHALITVRQKKGQLVSIRSDPALYGNNQQQSELRKRKLKVWKECDDVQDYVTVYDGYTTRDPVIIKFCGGGEPVPDLVSSSHEMLVVFTSSPYGTFLQPPSSQLLHGFQLEIEIHFVDKDSPTYIENKTQCEFWLRGTNRGVLESPLHSLSRNTTCLYHLQGIDMSVSQTPGMFRPSQPKYPIVYGQPSNYWHKMGFPYPLPRYRVWLSLLKFHVTTGFSTPVNEEKHCASHLNVWDGMMKSPSDHCHLPFCDKSQDGSEVDRNKIKNMIRVNAVGSGGGSGGGSSGGRNNIVLLSRFCNDKIPRSCDHTLLTNLTRPAARPCTLKESFLSTGDSLTLELKITESTALRPVRFSALYEFVDLYQDGEPYGTGPCSRRFVSRTQEHIHTIAQKFHAPKNVFLYGRGGAVNLSCVYRFEAQKGERIQLQLTRVLTGKRRCRTFKNIDTGRLQCYGNRSATVRIYELPWTDSSPLPRDCLCNADEEVLPFTFISSSNFVELRFDVIGMNATDDFETMFFEGTWEFIRRTMCLKNRRLSGSSGEIQLISPSRTPSDVNCENLPLLILPKENRYLYVKIQGVYLNPLPLFTEVNNTITIIQPPSDRSRCATKNRIIVYTGGNVYVTICPEPVSAQENYVEVFSEGWIVSRSSTNQPYSSSVEIESVDKLADVPSNTIIVDFIGIEAGSYTVMWLELIRRSTIPSINFITAENRCVHHCPELDACINSTLWCDGIAQCPSGFDEALTHCSFILKLPVGYLILGSFAILCAATGICYVLNRICKRRRRSILQMRLKSLSSETAIIDEKEVIC